MLRKAKISDAKDIHSLVNHYAQTGVMLTRSLSDIYDNIRDYFVVDDSGKISGCVALHISWEDLAEIKALAVDEGAKGKGWGRQLVDACMKEARELGIKRVFALTLIPDFFKKMGFKPINKKKLPQKVWGECINCFKFTECDEISLAYDF